MTRKLRRKLRIDLLPCLFTTSNLECWLKVGFAILRRQQTYYYIYFMPWWQFTNFITKLKTLLYLQWTRNRLLALHFTMSWYYFWNLSKAASQMRKWGPWYNFLDISDTLTMSRDTVINNRYTLSRREHWSQAKLMNQDSLDSAYQLQRHRVRKFQVNFHLHLIKAAFLTQRNAVHVAVIYKNSSIFY